MNIALLCPGPSLAAFPGREGFDCVIAVNRAALRVAADYWVMLDGHTFDFGEPLGHPIVVARASMIRQMRHKLAARPHETLPLERIELPREWPAKWDTMSATAALALAGHLGATSVDVWGADWKGTADWDGFTHVTMRRDAERWAKEKGIWNALVELLAKRGITVMRHTGEFQVPGSKFQAEVAPA